MAPTAFPNLGQITLCVIATLSDGALIIAGTGQNPDQTSYPVLEVRRQ